MIRLSGWADVFRRTAGACFVERRPDKALAVLREGWARPSVYTNRAVRLANLGWDIGKQALPLGFAALPTDSSREVIHDTLFVALVRHHEPVDALAFIDRVRNDTALPRGCRVSVLNNVVEACTSVVALIEEAHTDVLAFDTPLADWYAGQLRGLRETARIAQGYAQSIVRKG